MNYRRVILCLLLVSASWASVQAGIITCAESAETVVHCYDNNENSSWTYCPDTPGDGTMMEILFYEGQIEGFFDHIQIFDGDDNTAPLLLDLSGAYPESFVAATNPDGCLYVQFTSDGSISCGSGNYDPVSWCAGCGQDDSCSNNAPTNNMVADVIINSEDHTLLEAALGAAGLVDPLSGEGPFTVFAPTDDAFTTLTEALGITAEELVAMPVFWDVLQYHVVGAEAYSTDLSDGQEIETLLGENLTVSITADGVFINNAQVIVADLTADNGVVHVIDAMLIPSATGQPTPLPFTEDFANGFAGNNGVGGWTVEDTGGGLIWQYVDESGNGFYADGSASGVNPPAGEFSTNIAPLNSTSASNGWVIYDNDYWNTPISEGYSDNEGWLTSPVLNLSESASVIVSWEQYFRYCCHPDAPVYLQVTNDGGESWVTFDGHGDFIEAPNTVSENGFTTTVDISCMAAGESNVQIRFSYLQAPETGEGYSHYFWGIDDVMIFEAPVNNDLEVLQVTNGDVSEGWELAVTPMEQLPLIENGGVLTGVMFRNVGNLDQTDVELQVEVLDTDGNLLESVTQNVGLVPASANSEQCPIHPSDTSYVSINWVPDEIGVYELRVTISSDAEDELPMNNVFSRMIEFSEEQMGHDKEAVDYEFVPSDSDIDGLFNPTGYGNHFKMENPGSLVYGLAIKFGPNSGGGVLEFETRLYEVQGTIEWEDALLNSTSWLYDDDWTPSELDQSEFVYLPFDSPVEVNATSSYFAAVISEFESEAQLTIAGNLNTDTDRSTGFYGMDNDGYFSWLSQGLGISELNSTPAIRLVFSPGEFSGCMDPEACNFSPAATTNGFCDYETCAGCMDEEACNFDSQATIEYNGVCTFPGCFDPEASNYSQNAGCEGECFYLTYDCASVGDAAWSDEAIGLFPEWQDAMHGVAWEGEWVFNVPATIVEPGSGVSYGVHHVEWSSMTGIPAWATTDYALADLEASSQHCIAASGTPATPGLHEITASGEVFISIFGQPFSIGEQSFSATLEVMANPNPIPGCTYPLASNYLSYATLDDGGCEYWGCTDIDAADFNPFANIDDGSCGDGCDPLTGSNCASDSNGDGQVNVTDLLILLGEFGGICE